MFGLKYEFSPGAYFETEQIVQLLLKFHSRIHFRVRVYRNNTIMGTHKPTHTHTPNSVLSECISPFRAISLSNECPICSEMPTWADGNINTQTNKTNQHVRHRIETVSYFACGCLCSPAVRFVNAVVFIRHVRDDDFDKRV